MLIVLAVFQGQKPLSEKNPNIFRHGAFLYFWKAIFRTLAYLELEAYSEHCQTPTMECFAKIAAQHIFQPQPQNFSRQIFFVKSYSYLLQKFHLNFLETELSFTFLKTFFLYFEKGIFRTVTWWNFSYISEKEYWPNFLLLYFLIFQEVTLLVQKMNRKKFFYFRKWNFFARSLKSSYIALQI